ncbi:unnamed protein product [Gongylonema pulchrum]|uniref:Uncharacterized protein n=1 Tax=Gongylonema pulchrum TaxID=637853 RepID=A0A183DIQ8_9BILA|nr:unnamed protein product [Gongylonema pulchrum]
MLVPNPETTAAQPELLNPEVVVTVWAPPVLVVSVGPELSAPVASTEFQEQNGTNTCGSSSSSCKRLFLTGNLWTVRWNNELLLRNAGFGWRKQKR